MFRTKLDPSHLFQTASRLDTELAREMSIALNDSAFDVRRDWAKEASKSFDRPTPFTLRAALVKKSTPSNLVAEVFVRDDASGGTPPVYYLSPQVHSGARTQKRFEWALSRNNRNAERFYLPGRSLPLDSHGNVSPAIIKRVMSQLQSAESVAGFMANETTRSKARRLKRQRKKGGGGSYFIMGRRRGKLMPGVIYERIDTGFGSGIRTVLYPAKKAPVYRKRWDVYTLTERNFRGHFEQRFRVRLRAMGR